MQKLPENNQYYSLIENYKKIKNKIEEIQRNNPYEVKGILYSEMAFMFSVLYGKTFGNILESGRARAQSTLLLSQFYPEKQIISVEFDKNSPDVAVATERLRNQTNVKQLFGDSFEILPKVLMKNDIVIIDGPKMFDSLTLTFQLMSTGKTGGVFVHDMYSESNERWFLNTFLPNCIHSDNIEFAKHSHTLDTMANEYIPTEKTIEYNKENKFGYGFNLCYIPYTNRNYKLLEFLSILFKFIFKIINKLK